MEGNHLVHEVEELGAPAALVVAGLDQAGRHLESGEQGGGAVALVAWAKPLSAWPFGSRSQPWARSSAWMCGFSSTHRTTACSGGFRYRPTISAALAANGIGAHAPAAPLGEADALRPQDPPHLVGGDVVAERRGQQPPVPAREAGGRRRVELGEDARLGGGIVARRRPPRGASSSPSRPKRANRPRHFDTVLRRGRRAARRSPPWPCPRPRTALGAPATPAAAPSAAPAPNPPAPRARPGTIQSRPAFIPAAYNYR